MKNKINKNEFLDRVAKNNGLDINVVKTVCHGMVDEMTNVLCNNQSLSLTGFGMFSLKPHKGHPVQFEAKTDKVEDYVVLKFTASDVLMDDIKKRLK